MWKKKNKKQLGNPINSEMAHEAVKYLSQDEAREIWGNRDPKLIKEFLKEEKINAS